MKERRCFEKNLRSITNKRKFLICSIKTHILSCLQCCIFLLLVVSPQHTQEFFSSSLNLCQFTIRERNWFSLCSSFGKNWLLSISKQKTSDYNMNNSRPWSHVAKRFSAASALWKNRCFTKAISKWRTFVVPYEIKKILHLGASLLKHLFSLECRQVWGTSKYRRKIFDPGSSKFSSRFLEKRDDFYGSNIRFLFEGKGAFHRENSFLSNYTKPAFLTCSSIFFPFFSHILTLLSYFNYNI
jgi:hypothetical protein